MISEKNALARIARFLYLSFIIFLVNKGDRK